MKGPNGTTVPVLGLVDSGADITLFDFSLAKLLEIDLEKATPGKTQGITGPSAKTFGTTLELEVLHLPPITIPVLFVKDLAVPCLLGQTGFFDLHRIKFEKDHKVFEVTPLKKKRK